MKSIESFAFVGLAIVALSLLSISLQLTCIPGLLVCVERDFLIAN